MASEQVDLTPRQLFYFFSAFSNCSSFLITYVYSTLLLFFFRIVLLIILIILFLRLNTSLVESSKLKKDCCRHSMPGTGSKSSCLRRGKMLTTESSNILVSLCTKTRDCFSVIPFKVSVNIKSSYLREIFGSIVMRRD